MKFLVIGGIDLSQNKETEIQLQYIEKCKELLAKSSTKHPTFHIQNEGCQMNSIQTESIAAIMEKMGYEMVDTEDADAVVFDAVFVVVLSVVLVVFCSLVVSPLLDVCFCVDVNRFSAI